MMPRGVVWLTCLRDGKPSRGVIRVIEFADQSNEQQKNTGGREWVDTN